MAAAALFVSLTALALVSGNPAGQRLGRNTDDARLVSNLLNLDCRPPPSGPSGSPGFMSPRPGASSCHLWVDGSGYCRVNWSHIITPTYCRDVIGLSRYNSLPGYGPGQAGAPDWDGGPPSGK